MSEPRDPVDWHDPDDPDDPLAAIAQAERRSQSYDLLSRLFLEQPDRALLFELKALLVKAGPGASEDEVLRLLEAGVQRALVAPERLTDLKVEYTRLLSGTVPGDLPPPYESMVMEGRAWGDVTQAVSALYAQAGLSHMASEGGPPDHLGLELRFMARLTRNEAAALRADDAEAARRAHDLQRRFVHDHLVRWAPHYCEQLSVRARSPFYQAVGLLAADLCRQDGQDLEPHPSGR